jgi:hypothetical protein
MTSPFRILFRSSITGHWVLALLGLYGTGGITTRTPAMLASWLWQVMPPFFFVGGFVHAQAPRSPSALRTAALDPHRM